jgi:Glycosyl transferases group 1
MEPVTFITEPLLDPEFVQFENVIEVLTRLAQKFDISVASPRLSPAVRRELSARGIHALDGGHSYMRPRHSRDEIPSYAMSWAHDSILQSNGRTIRKLLSGRDDLVVNVSMTTAYPSDIWFVQSPPLGLDAMSKSVDGWLSLAFTFGRLPVGLIDAHHLSRCAQLSSRIYSTTHWVGNYYRQRGMAVRGVLPNYYHSNLSPSTGTPSRDYLLGYLGKETDSAALKMVMESGLPMKLFGSKSPGFVRKLTSHGCPPNVEVLGPVTWAELRELYSNAAFTVFPFTDEPFGLVPLESMACGTPVLTYGIQGPGETVIDGRTGWLVNSPSEFLDRATQLFREGNPSVAAAACVERARRFSADRIARTWEELLRATLNGEEDPASLEPLGSGVGIQPFASLEEPPSFPEDGRRSPSPLTARVTVDWQGSMSPLAVEVNRSFGVFPDTSISGAARRLTMDESDGVPRGPSHRTSSPNRALRSMDRRARSEASKHDGGAELAR